MSSKPKRKKSAKATASSTLSENGNCNANNGDAVLPKKETSTENIEEMYRMKSPAEYILFRPHAFIGCIENRMEHAWVYNGNEKCIEHCRITYVPGLYRIFDEILINAVDNKRRDPKMDCIRINIHQKENIISIWNNGKGIPPVKHAVTNMLVPTMMFGHVFTSSHYDDGEENFAGFRNGFGAKLCNIFSTKFTVETSSKEYGKKFKQTWTENMSKTTAPTLEVCTKDYTRITFSPDLKKFHVSEVNYGMVQLMLRRVSEVAAFNRDLKVCFNGEKISFYEFGDSFPSMVDGLTIGSRKVLYTCLREQVTSPLDIAELSAWVELISNEGCKEGVIKIIKLAQNFVGSNNISLIEPFGQFGTRLLGGEDYCKDLAQISAQLNHLTRFIFDPKDDNLVNYAENETSEFGTQPEWYIPVIPMILVNGDKYSRKADNLQIANIPNHHPRQIVENLQRMIRGLDPLPMKPWYKGFRGEIEKLDETRFVTRGKIAVIGKEKVEITELPIGTWTQTYKENVLLPALRSISNPTNDDEATLAITNFKEMHSDTAVKFEISMNAEKLIQAQSKGLHEVFKLQSEISTAAMYAYDRNGFLKKYSSTTQILGDFFDIRLEYYGRRKGYFQGLLDAQAEKLGAQARFVTEIRRGSLKLAELTVEEIIAEIKNRKYPADPVRAFKIANRLVFSEEEVLEGKEGDRDFHYLYGLDLSAIRCSNWKNDYSIKYDFKLMELTILKQRSPLELWKFDLDTFLAQLNEIENKEQLESSCTLYPSI